MRPAIPSSGELAPVRFREFLAGDVVQLALQPSQRIVLGMTSDATTIAHGEGLAAIGPAWTAIHDGRVICCAGFNVLWPANALGGGHAVAWALLAGGIGAAHLALSRFARAKIEGSGFARIEAVVRADAPREAAWAAAVGLKRAALLHCWGPEAKPHFLYERVRPFDAAQDGGQ